MSLFRPVVEGMQGYLPGEQPREQGWVKLNTNENPYPPSPLAVEAIERAARGRLNIYPDPLVNSFCRVAADLFDLDPDWILPANGSDENLTILIRTFVDADEQIALPYPSYILYETLAEIQGANPVRLPLGEDWSFDFETLGDKIQNSKIVFIPNPNSPSGNRWSDEELARLVPPSGILVLDEAYGDFADNPHRCELLRSEFGSNLVVTRTLSKSYSLAGLRFGFCVAHPDLIAGMRKVKDSYNCDTLSIAAATAAIEDQKWMLANRARIISTRKRLSSELAALGFCVQPSEANFVWTTHPEHNHETLFQQLKNHKVLVRFMKFPFCGIEENKTRDGLRITIGTDAEIDRLLEVLRTLLSSN